MSLRGTSHKGSEGARLDATSWADKVGAERLAEFESMPSQGASARAVGELLEQLADDLRKARDVERHDPSRVGTFRPSASYSLLRSLSVPEIGTQVPMSSVVGVISLHALPNGTILAGCRDNCIRVISLHEHGLVSVRPLPASGEVQLVRGMPDGSIIASDGDSIRIYRAPREFDVREEVIPDSDGVRRLTVLPGGELVGATSTAVMRWAPLGGGQWSAETIFRVTLGSTAQMLPDGRILLLDRTLRICAEMKPGAWVSEFVCGDSSLRDFLPLRSGEVLGIEPARLRLFTRRSEGLWEERPVEIIDRALEGPIRSVQELGTGELLVAAAEEVFLLSRCAGEEGWVTRTLLRSKEGGEIYCMQAADSGVILIGGETIFRIREDVVSLDWGHGWVQCYSGEPHGKGVE